MSGNLFSWSLQEQTTFYNVASYCGRLHYSGLCFAHCQDMHGIAPHGDFLLEHQVVCSDNICGNRLLSIILHPVVVVFVLRIAEICMVLLHMVLHTWLIQLHKRSFPHQLLLTKDQWNLQMSKLLFSDMVQLYFRLFQSQNVKRMKWLLFSDNLRVTDIIRRAVKSFEN